MAIMLSSSSENRMPAARSAETARWRDRDPETSASSSRRRIVERDRRLARARSIIDQPRSPRAARRCRPWRPCSRPFRSSPPNVAICVSTGEMTADQPSIESFCLIDGNHGVAETRALVPGAFQGGDLAEGLARRQEAHRFLLPVSPFLGRDMRQIDVGLPAWNYQA